MEPVLIGLLCRTSERSAAAAHGTEALTRELGRRHGIEPRLVGSAPRDAEPAGWEEDLQRSRGCLLEAGGQVDDALVAGVFPILVAGHCSIAMTTLPAVARHKPEAKVLWLDAHGDFNSPETTESGFLGGMCLAGACGVWGTGLAEERAPADRLVLCGVRDLDRGERELLERSTATIIGTALETLVYLQNALDGSPVFVHLDLDVLDPEVFPAQYPADDGLSEEKLYDLLDAVADSCDVVGLEITGFEAPEDAEERDRLARIAADAVQPLLAAAA